MLTISNLLKASPKKLLMTDVNLTLHEGEILALVGEHKSGKSLLTKLILTISHKTSGKIKVSTNQYIGAFVPNEKIMPNITVKTAIKDYCQLRDYPYNGNNVKNILALFNLRKHLNHKISQLTLTECDLLKIAMPLILRTDILILDSPFENLSAKQTKDLRVLLKKISNELRTSILITASKMADIEEICDTIAIIDDGMIISIQSYNAMIAREMDQSKLGVTVAEPNYAAKVIEEEFKVPALLCGDQIIINLKPERVQDVVNVLIAAHITVISAQRVFRSLDYQYWELINNRKKYY
ncbi:MAG: ATP-binding cassette domain-containing protein [Clostridia bacterium]|nr:ATP-binding cassette domain-containing protein [Clostridia bacterium]